MKMNKKWIVLCSSAIAAVYAAGYVVTENQAAEVSMLPATETMIQTSGGGPDSATLRTGTNENSASNPDDSSETGVTSPSMSHPSSQYKDGTYTGMGSNRRGSIEVAVTIKNDHIKDVEVSRFGMHYSQRDIAGLPDEVLRNQNARVTNVSGATYSTQAFEDAIQDALSQALNG